MMLENVVAKLSTDTGRRESLLLLPSAGTQMKGVSGHLAGGQSRRASYIVYMSDYGSWYSY